MLNKIWSFLIIFGLLISIVSGEFFKMGNIILDSINDSFEIILVIILSMTFWRGIFEISLKSGVIDYITNILYKPISKIFLDCNDLNILRLVTSNIIANLLGLSHAATPIGLEAIRTIDDSKVTNNKRLTARLILINCSGISIIPTSIFAIRNKASANTPIIIIIIILGLTILSSIISLTLERITYKP